MIRKTSLSSDRSDSTAVKQCRQSANTNPTPATCVARDVIGFHARRSASSATYVTAMLGAILPLHDVRYHAPASNDRWRARNCVSRTSKRPASPTQERGGARRDRTDDLLLAKQALSQLSYGPIRDQ